LALVLISSTQSLQAATRMMYIPVEPCRIVDTRNTATTSIPADSSISVVAYGAAGDLDAQGGDGAGCPQPKAAAGVKPAAVTVNVTAVGNQASGNGNLVLYPSDVAPTVISLVNYTTSANLANSSIVRICVGPACISDFDIRSNFSAVPAVVDVQGYFYAMPSGIAEVALSGGDYNSPVDAMNDLASWCGTPSMTNRCQVRIAPGEYDLGSNQLVMQEWVSVTGSGQEETSITGSVNGELVAGADNVQLTNMSIVNTGSGTNSVAIRNTAVSPLLSDLTVSASGGSSNTFGIFNDGGTATMQNLVVSAQGGISATYGIYNKGASTSMTNLTVKATGGSLFNYAVFNFNGVQKMLNVDASAFGGTKGIAVYNFGVAAPEIRYSEMTGSTLGVSTESSGFAPTVITASVISGGASADNICFSSNDGVADLPSTCQAPPAVPLSQ